MLLFIEHDAVMATAEARKALADFVGHRPGINLALFHTADECDDDVRASYPAVLRERLVLTPKTPRARDLRFWVAYEAGCVWAAMRHNGQLTQCEAWVALVPPTWEGCPRPVRRQACGGHPCRLHGHAKRLARTLSTYRRVPVDPESSDRNLASSASAVPMASSSAAVKTGSRGRSAGHSIRAASSAKRSASSASILG